MRSAALVAVTAVASHLTALRAGFVWLDHAHIEERAALVEKGKWLAAFTHGFAGTGYYRPLMSLSLSLDALAGGATAYHATSIACHAAAAVMTTITAEALGLSRRAALLAGLVFAAHPLSALVANAIAFRSEAILAFGLLLLVWAHLRGRAVVAGLAIALAALTKETGLVLAPLFVVALVLRRRKKKEEEQPKTPRPIFAAEAIAVAACAWLRMRYGPAWRATHEPLAVADAIGTRLASVGKSVAAVVLPVDRSICDAFPITHWWQPGAIAGLAVVVVIVMLAWRERRIALLLACATLPLLQIVPVARWWSPHYLYVPFAFVAMLAAAFADERLRKKATRVVGVVVVLLGALTLYEGQRYADDASLWSPEVTRQPACREGQFYLGEVERNAKQWEAAARRYEAALAPRPRVLAFVDRGAALQNLGTVRLEQSRFADARRAFAAALEGTSDPLRRRELTHNLAAASFGDGDPNEALRLLASEIERPDALRPSLLVAKAALEKLGRHDEARRLMERHP